MQGIQIREDDSTAKYYYFTIYLHSTYRNSVEKRRYSTGCSCRYYFIYTVYWFLNVFIAVYTIMANSKWKLKEVDDDQTRSSRQNRGGLEKRVKILRSSTTDLVPLSIVSFLEVFPQFPPSQFQVFRNSLGSKVKLLFKNCCFNIEMWLVITIELRVSGYGKFLVCK